MAADLQREKEAAARHAAAYVQDGMTVGLGTGSTASLAIRWLAGRRLDIRGVATSAAAEALARECGIPLADFNDVPGIDIAIDGADEIAPGLALIKGGGGALLREKLVAGAAKRFVVIADSTKLVARLGRFPLPVEVIPFAWRHVEAKLKALALNPVARDLVTDNGNRILDCHAGEIANPGALAVLLKAIPGVVDHGLFLGLATEAVIGAGESVRVLRP